MKNKRAEEGGARGMEGKKKEGKKKKSQDLESPGSLVFVVQTVCGIEVEFPRGGGLFFVIQAVRGVEGQSCATIGLVVVVMVVVVP